MAAPSVLGIGNAPRQIIIIISFMKHTVIHKILQRNIVNEQIQ